MKLARVQRGRDPVLGIVDGDEVFVATGQLHNPTRGDRIGSLEHLRLLAPVTPTKVIAVGRNFASRAAELGLQRPTAPVLSIKLPSAVIGPDETIEYPTSSSRVGIEGELAAVISRVARRIDAAEAAHFVLGFTCLNDVIALDHMAEDTFPDRGKNHDTFCPIGPLIETDVDLASVRVQTILNGTVCVEGSPREMYFGVAEIVSFVSHVLTLVPGDVISFGAPGCAEVRPGDVAEVSIDGIGTLRNPVG